MKNPYKLTQALLVILVYMGLFVWLGDMIGWNIKIALIMFGIVTGIVAACIGFLFLQFWLGERAKAWDNKHNPSSIEST